MINTVNTLQLIQDELSINFQVIEHLGTGRFASVFRIFEIISK